MFAPKVNSIKQSGKIIGTPPNYPETASMKGKGVIKKGNMGSTRKPK